MGKHPLVARWILGDILLSFVANFYVLFRSRDLSGKIFPVKRWPKGLSVLGYDLYEGAVAVGLHGDDIYFNI